MYRIIMTSLVIALIAGAIVMATSNKSVEEYAGLMPEVVVTAPKHDIERSSETGVMPEVVVTAKKPKQPKSPLSEIKDADSLIEYAALDLRTKLYDKFDKGKIDQLADLKISGNYKVGKNDTIKDDVVVTGGNAIIDGVIKGDLAVMGGAVDVNGLVNGDVAIFGGNLDIIGRICCDVAVFGGNINNKGTIGGGLFVVGGNVSLDSGSSVNGEISMIGGSLQRDTNAIVKGEIKSIDVGQLNRIIPRIINITRFPGKFPSIRPRLGIFQGIFSLAALIVLYVLNLLVLIIFPKPIERIVNRIQSNVWLPVALGIGLEILYVPLIVLFAVSIIGIPIIPLFILAVFVAVLFGFTALSSILGDRIKKGFNWQINSNIGTFSLGWIAIMIIPILGIIFRKVAFVGTPIFILGLIIYYVTITIGLGGVLATLIKKEKA
ncbi:MAG: hypothetical protein OEZ20_08675 [candidate division WOR-3 bacterium]|nr:hypothetical protein [candidate division WOR-3 bacterium]